MLVLVILIAKMGLMLHELEHDPLSEESHGCALCLSAPSLDKGAISSPAISLNMKFGDSESAPVISLIPLHHRFNFLSRAPPLNTPA